MMREVAKRQKAGHASEEDDDEAAGGGDEADEEGARGRKQTKADPTKKGTRAASDSPPLGAGVLRSTYAGPPGPGTMMDPSGPYPVPAASPFGATAGSGGLGLMQGPDPIGRVVAAHDKHGVGIRANQSGRGSCQFPREQPGQRVRVFLLR